MAKKKKLLAGVPAQSLGGERISTDISNAENGFVISVSGETGGKNPSYFSKRYIAATRPEALRIAANHFGSLKGGKKKSGGKKKAATKR